MVVEEEEEHVPLEEEVLSRGEVRSPSQPAYSSPFGGMEELANKRVLFLNKSNVLRRSERIKSKNGIEPPVAHGANIFQKYQILTKVTKKKKPF